MNLQKRTRFQAELGSQAGSVAGSGDVQMGDDAAGIGKLQSVVLAPGPQAMGSEQGAVTSAKRRPRAPPGSQMASCQFAPLPQLAVPPIPPKFEMGPGPEQPHIGQRPPAAGQDLIGEGTFGSDPVAESDLARTQAVVAKSSFVLPAGSGTAPTLPVPPPFPGQRDVRELDKERRAAGLPTFEETHQRRWGQQPQQQQQQHWQSGTYEKDWSASAGGTSSWGGQRPFVSPSPQRTSSELEGRRDWARTTSGYDPTKDRTQVPKGVRAYGTIRPSMVDNLWELADDFQNYNWDERTQVNCMTIGYERAASNPNATVQWTCEWVDEKKWFKRIGPVAEVDKIRSIGGVIPVSPQEFALIP